MPSSIVLTLPFCGAFAPEVPDPQQREAPPRACRPLLERRSHQMISPATSQGPEAHSFGPSGCRWQRAARVDAGKESSRAQLPGRGQPAGKDAGLLGGSCLV